MGTLATKYDIRQPSAGGAKGAYSAIVHIDGSMIVAEDPNGNRIASGDAGVNDAAIIQAVASAIGCGSIFLKRANDTNTKYVLTSKISLNPGLFIYSDAAYLDVTQLNDIAFEWNAGGAYYSGAPVRSGISNIFVRGATGNANTKLARAINIARDLVFEKINTNFVNNVIALEGGCYDSVVQDVFSAEPRGTWISLKGLNSEGQRPNNTLIDHCEMSCSPSTPATRGIEILSGSIDYPQNIHIRDCWIEQAYEGIYNEGYATIIENTPIIAAPKADNDCKCIYIKNTALSGTAQHTTIRGCKPLAGSSDYGYVIYISAPYRYATLIDNYIAYGAIAQLFMDNDNYLMVKDTTFSNTKNGTIMVSGWPARSLFSGCRFVGNGYQTAFSVGNTVDGSVVDCEFYNLGSSFAGNWQNAIITGNIFNAAGTIVVNENSKVFRNFGYITESSGSSIGTGAEQTIAHRLAAAPRKISIIPQVPGAMVICLWADATNIYPTVTCGKPFDWSADA
jgi:hypothetical protein